MDLKTWELTLAGGKRFIQANPSKCFGVEYSYKWLHNIRFNLEVFYF